MSVNVNSPWKATFPSTTEPAVSDADYLFLADTTGTSLEDLMSEELARELQNEENAKAGLTPFATNTTSVGGVVVENEAFVGDGGVDVGGAFDQEDVSSDWLMAQMLQKEFDAEHDKQVQRYEKAINGNNKIAISYNQYKLLPGQYDSSSSDDSDIEPEEKWKMYMEAEKTRNILPTKKAMVKTSEGQKITKHDAVLSGKRNVSRMECFGPTFKSGDGTGMDLKLSNKVYESLKTHSYRQESRAARLHENKDNSSSENAMDAKTSLMLMKLVDSGLLNSVGGCVSTGKEANIYHAFGGEPTERITEVPSEIALKIHKSTLNEFKARDQYIADDYRFKKHYSKQNSRKVVEQWALKEFLNLERMRRHDVRCPRAVKVKKNLVMMEFLGDQGFPAPTLKEASLADTEWDCAFDQTVQCVKDLYRKCKLVHADMSEYNLLWLKSQVYVIDVSQSVDIGHPRAHQFLLRDCKNLMSFFNKKLSHQKTPMLKDFELFNMITGQKLHSGEELDLLAQIEAFESNQELLTYQMSRTDFPFDYLYDKSHHRFSWMQPEQTKDAQVI